MRDATSDGDFSAASAVEPTSDPGLFAARVPAGWAQGRGAFGGLVLGLLARAALRVEPERDRALRTLSGELCGPVLPGPVELRVRALRRGASQSNYAMELWQDGAVLATASTVLSRPRRAALATLAPEAPEEPASEGVEVPLGRGMGPEFAQHYRYENLGPAPFSGGPAPRADGYLRERAPLAALDAPAMIARLDAWWPAFFACESAPRAAVTVSFAAQLLVDPATVDPRRALRHRGFVFAQRDGFSVEQRELWLDGALLATNQQTLAVLT